MKTKLRMFKQAFDFLSKITINNGVLEREIQPHETVKCVR